MNLLNSPPRHLNGLTEVSSLPGREWSPADFLRGTRQGVPPCLVGFLIFISSCRKLFPPNRAGRLEAGGGKGRGWSIRLEGKGPAGWELKLGLGGSCRGPVRLAPGSGGCLVHGERLW